MRFASRLIVLSCVLILEPTRVSTQPQECDRIIEGIRVHDTAMIAAAGKTRNKFFAPYLHRVLQDKLVHPSVESAARFALAQLGDVEALQERFCRVNSEHPTVSTRAMEDTTEIGGWFAIQTLERMFERDQAFEAGMRKFRKDIPPDLVLTLPSQLAIRALDRVVPDPSKPSALLEDRSKAIAEWKRWISQNRSALVLLQPDGAGVDISPSGCKSSKFRRMEKKWIKELD